MCVCALINLCFGILLCPGQYPIEWRRHHTPRVTTSSSSKRHDMLSSESINYETYQQLLNSTMQMPSDGDKFNDNDEEDADADYDDEPSMTQAKMKNSQIKSYPISDATQLYCDQVFDGGGDEDAFVADTITEQRIIIESEQLELFLRLHAPNGNGGAAFFLGGGLLSLQSNTSFDIIPFPITIVWLWFD